MYKRQLLRCFPFGPRSLGLLGVAVGGTALVHFAGADWPLVARMGATGGALLAFGGAALTFGRTADDDELIAKVKRKLGRLLGRGGD